MLAKMDRDQGPRHWIKSGSAVRISIAVVHDFAAPPPLEAHTFDVHPQVVPPYYTREPALNIFSDQHYALEPTFKSTGPYDIPQPPEFPPNTEKPVMTEEQEEIARKLRSLELTMKNLQGLGGYKSVSYKDLCMFPGVHLPLGFKMPKFEKYDEHGDLVAYLRCYCNQLRGVGGKEELLMAYFSESLSGLASEWFVDQDFDKWNNWDDLANEFVQQFQYNMELIPDEKSLTGKPFIEVLKMGEMIEDEIKTSRIVSFTALKATTQAIQKGSGSVGGKKNEEDASAIIVGQQARARGPYHRYPRAQTQVYGQVPQNFSQNPLYSISPSPYQVYNAQPYVQPPSYPYWRTLTLPRYPPTPHTYRSPSRPGFQFKPNNKMRQKSRDSFTPIGESYVSLFQRLVQHSMITPLLGYIPDLHSRSFDPNEHMLLSNQGFQSLNIMGRNILTSTNARGNVAAHIWYSNPCSPEFRRNRNCDPSSNPTGLDQFQSDSGGLLVNGQNENEHILSSRLRSGIDKQVLAYANDEREGLIYEKPFTMGESITKEKVTSHSPSTKFPSLNAANELDFVSKLKNAIENNCFEQIMKDLGDERYCIDTL
ncbi:hypothetical protein FXO37_16805 [Capsicum annuum]|nr:hypothetical protein FXO37_16805 [Capsicum annuum]